MATSISRFIWQAAACMTLPFTAAWATAPPGACNPGATDMPRAALHHLRSAARNLGDEQPHGSAQDLRAAAGEIGRLREGLSQTGEGRLQDDVLALQRAAAETDAGTLRSRWKLQARLAPVALHLAGYELRSMAGKWTHEACPPASGSAAAPGR